MKIKNLFIALLPWYGSGVRFRIWLRIRELCRKRNWDAVGQCIKAHLQYKYGCELSVHATISPKAQFMHTVGVVIGEGAVVSDGVMIYSGVVLGRKDINEDEYPIIEKNVILCTGAVVLGNVRIGAYATVGAKSLVLHDVNSGDTVFGIPARKKE